MEATLKEKIEADFHLYVILGACNPKMAPQALQAEDKIGTMLPCNVIVQERDPTIANWISRKGTALPAGNLGFLVFVNVGVFCLAFRMPKRSQSGCATEKRMH